MSEQPSEFRTTPFPATAWTFLRAVPEAGTPAYRDALNRLIAAYWKAVFAAAHMDAGPAAPPTQDDLARQFGLTRDQVRYRLAQTEGAFVRLLRARVQEEVGSEA